MEEAVSLFTLAIAWLIYFTVHSFLASLWVKRHVEAHFSGFMPWYRITFNFLALVLLIIPLWLMYSRPGELIIDWTGYAQWMSHLAALLAIAGFIWSARYYDTDEFLGLRQARENICSVEDQENFRISPLHRYVRHPWYFLGLILIWTRDMDAGFLLSASLLSLYFIIGSRLEEKKLLAYHGQVYRQYLQKVPGLIPLPWRYLTCEQAQQLLSNSTRGTLEEAASCKKADKQAP